MGGGELSERVTDRAVPGQMAGCTSRGRRGADLRGKERIGLSGGCVDGRGGVRGVGLMQTNSLYGQFKTNQLQGIHGYGLPSSLE